MRAAMTRPPRMAPLVPRERRTLGWFSDEALAKLKAKLEATPASHDPKARRLIESKLRQVENEQAERRLDPKPAVIQAAKE
jgi:hypothetical protein